MAKKIDEGMDENDVKKLLHQWFKDREGWSYAPVQSGMGVHGIPDRVGCIPVTITPDMVGQTVGLFVGIEAKAPGRRGQKDAGCSPLQVTQLTGIVDAAGLGYVVDGPSDLEHLDRTLSALQVSKLVTDYDWFATNIHFFNARVRRHG